MSKIPQQPNRAAEAVYSRGWSSEEEVVATIGQYESTVDPESHNMETLLRAFKHYLDGKRGSPGHVGGALRRRLGSRRARMACSERAESDDNQGSDEITPWRGSTYSIHWIQSIGSSGSIGGCNGGARGSGADT